MGAFPNTYTFTKSMAEQIIAEYHKTLPVCIVRPSMITAAIAEPYPGWVDSYGATTTPMVLIGRGILKIACVDSECVADMIPVDIVSKTIITAAWTSHRSYNPDSPVPVIHCTSGDINPINWGQFSALLQKFSRSNPFLCALAYPQIRFQSQAVVFFLEHIYHHLPALLGDLVIRLKGGKPVMLATANKIKMSMKLLGFFMTHNFIFKADNMREVMQMVQKTQDKDAFYCDVSRINWKEYMCDYMLGIRKYLLLEDDESLGEARKRIIR